MYPNSMLARKIMPKCTGWMPNNSPRGKIKGTTTIIAENISIKQPVINKAIFRSKRKIYLELMLAWTHSVNFMGISVSMM